MGLEGEWFNELGSRMVLTLDGENVRGEYHTAVGDADGIYQLSGRVEPAVPGATERTVGWVVSWKNEKRYTRAVTTWSGQWQLQNPASGGEPEEWIAATWLLTSDTPPAEDWKSTLVGQDVFTRKPPDALKIARRRRSARAHPSSA